MSNNKLLDVVKCGGIFAIIYGRNMFVGTISEFASSCKNFADYRHLPNRCFSMAVYVGGKEYEVERGFKSILLNAIKEEVI